jgi:hypothetical protein
MVIRLKHAQSGLIKEVPAGFSWTTLFFGAFVPLFRGDLKWFFIFIVISIFTFGLAWFVIPFIYNKIYLKELLQKGFVPADEISENYLIQKGLIVPSSAQKHNANNNSNNTTVSNTAANTSDTKEEN